MIYFFDTNNIIMNELRLKYIIVYLQPKNYKTIQYVCNRRDSRATIQSKQDLKVYVNRLTNEEVQSFF
jgi:viroplasmin and RNaseH domain-containing protein